MKDDLVVFAETSNPLPKVTFKGRLDLKPSNHLIIWQYPPSEDVFKQMLDVVKPKNVYLVGRRDSDFDEPAQFLKRLFGGKAGNRETHLCFPKT